MPEGLNWRPTAFSPKVCLRSSILDSPLECNRFGLLSHGCSGDHLWLHLRSGLAPECFEYGSEAIVGREGFGFHSGWHGEVDHGVAFELERTLPGAVHKADVDREVLGDLRGELLAHALGEDLRGLVGEFHVLAVGDDDHVGFERFRGEVREDHLHRVLSVAIDSAAVAFPGLARLYEEVMPVV